MGLYFPEERWADLERGLGLAAPDFGFEDTAEYGRWLLSSPLTNRQIEALAGRLTVGETYFFRDRNSFDLLEGNILPELIRKRRKAGRYLRIWSAGCATGEEPYSIAILLRRLMPDIGDWNITILATDINTSFLRKAEGGIYSEWSFRDVPSWVKEGFFRKNGSGFELFPELRKSVSFFYHNLAEDVYPSLANNTNGMDIMLCRNVLMYFTEAGQRKVIGRLYRCLTDGGWLMVSPAEISLFKSLPQSDAQLPGSTLYRKDVGGKAAFGCDTAVRPIADNPTSGFPSTPPFAAGTDLVVPQPLPVSESRESTPVSREEADPYREALALYEQGCYADAQEKISALLAGDISSGPALALLSRIHADQGRLTDALEICERAIATDKLTPAYHYLRAVILLEMGQEDESKTCLNRALYLDQDFVLAHFALGNLARRKGMRRETDRHFNNALSILQSYRPDNIVPESGGISAERMIDVISVALTEEMSA